MDFTFDFELCVETERYEREYLFAMSGYAYYSNAIYTEDDCFAGLNFSEHITLIEIKRASNGTPIALLLRCTECDIGANEQIIEHEMLMGDELYVSNVTYYIEYPDSKIDLNNALLECGTFIYHSDYGNIGEDELDHVFLLFTDRDDISESCTTTFDVEEVKAIRWMNINDIESELNDNPLLYSTWFRPAYTLALKELKSQASFRRIAIDN